MSYEDVRKELISINLNNMFVPVCYGPEKELFPIFMNRGEEINHTYVPIFNEADLLVSSLKRLGIEYDAVCGIGSAEDFLSSLKKRTHKKLFILIDLRIVDGGVSSAAIPVEDLKINKKKPNRLYYPSKN